MSATRSAFLLAALGGLAACAPAAVLPRAVAPEGAPVAAAPPVSAPPRPPAAAAPEDEPTPGAPAPRADAGREIDGPGDEDAAPSPPAEERPELADLRTRILEAARRRVGHVFAGDCSRFVLTAFADAGVGVRLEHPSVSKSGALYEASVQVATPRPGDLAFFHDTYDRNRNHRADDPFTHVALVESVDGSSVVLIHRSGRRIERLRMDLARPDDGEANDLLRVRRRGDVPGTRYLAGELFTAFGALLGGEFTQMLQSSHAHVAHAAQAATDDRGPPEPSRGRRRHRG